MSAPTRLVLLVAGAGEDEPRALERELRTLLPDTVARVVSADPGEDSVGPAAQLRDRVDLVVLSGKDLAGRGAEWLSAAHDAGVPAVALPELEGATAPQRAVQVAFLVRGVLGLVPSRELPGPDPAAPPPGTPIASVPLQKDVVETVGAASALEVHEGPTVRLADRHDVAFVRELRADLTATRTQLTRLEATPWGRLARSSARVTRGLARVSFRLRHPVDTLRTLSAEHLPPLWRARALTLLQRLGLRHEPQGDLASFEASSALAISRSAPARPVVVWLSDRPWDAQPGRPQHLARALAGRGWPVLFVCRRPHRELARGTDTAREVSERVLEVSLPPDRACDPEEWLQPRELLAHAGRILDLVDAIGLKEAVVVVERPDWWPLAEHLRDTVGWPVVYDRTERRWELRHDGPRAREVEARVMRSADGIWAASAALERTAPATSHLVGRVGNAVDRGLWSSPALSSPELPARPRVVCHAALDALVDIELLRELAHARPGWSIVLAGEVGAADVAALAALPNVHLLRPPSPEALPGFLAAMDLGVLPFVHSDLTEGMDPVELHEMVAAGLPVVATPLFELASHREFLEVAEGPRELLAIADRALGRPGRELGSRRGRPAPPTWQDQAAHAEAVLEQTFPLVSIVVVTFNNVQLSRLCLDSVLAATEYPNFEVIVVDNASTDTTRDWLAGVAREHDRVRFVLNGENRGFAAASNQGVRLAAGELLCLLNNDTVVTRGWLSTLVRAVRQDRRLGMVGPVTNAIGNEARVRARYGSLEELPEWAARYTRAHAGTSFELPMLALFCAVLRREVWDEVGELDEQFEIGMFEDNDFCRRVRAAGYELRCLRDAFVHHWQRASFRLLGDDLYWQTYAANRARFRAKWRT